MIVAKLAGSATTVRLAGPLLPIEDGWTLNLETDLT
jgi:hypothetical protein